MRTTLNIDAELLAQAKLIAAREHRTIGSVVDEALQSMVTRQSTEAALVQPLPDFAYRGGLIAGVDLYDKELMADLLDGDDSAHALS